MSKHTPTDRELLERAAKAAGIYRDALDCEWYDPQGHVRPGWNPLADSGDALELAVKLHLMIDTYDPRTGDDAVEVQAWHTMANLCVEPRGSDPAAATRRAIVRAAAAISDGEPKS